MIRFVVGDDLGLVPKFFCDVCSGEIDNDAAAVFAIDPSGPATFPMFSLLSHKGSCSDVAGKRIKNESGSCCWYGMQEFFRKLVDKGV